MGELIKEAAETIQAGDADTCRECGAWGLPHVECLGYAIDKDFAQFEFVCCRCECAWHVDIRFTTCERTVTQAATPDLLEDLGYELQ